MDPTLITLSWAGVDQSSLLSFKIIFHSHKIEKYNYLFHLTIRSTVVAWTPPDYKQTLFLSSRFAFPALYLLYSMTSRNTKQKLQVLFLITIGSCFVFLV